MTTYAIGTTSSLTELPTLSAVPNMAVASTYGEYQELITLADGSQRGIGSPWVEWRWGFIPYDQWAALRAICTGASASVYIRTIASDYSTPTWKHYTATMLWPAPGDYEYRGGPDKVYMDFRLRFVNLVEYTP